MTTILLQTIVEKIDLVSAARKAATQQAYKGAALVRLASHLRQAVAGAGLTGHDLVEVVGGASLSVRRFYADYSFIEGFGFDQKYPQLNEVMLIGPDNAAIDAVFGLVEMAKDVSGNLQTLDLSKLWKGAQAMWSAKEAIGGADGLLDDAYVHGLQRTHFIERGCIFTTAPGCSQLLFPNGFNSVYTYDTSGQRFFSGLPVPIIVLVRNGVDGQFAVSFATVPFIPDRPGID
ncbi:MAG: hypothetical protein U1F11_15040 [Steroidobacteraceae bacterium]